MDQSGDGECCDETNTNPQNATADNQSASDLSTQIHETAGLWLHTLTQKNHRHLLRKCDVRVRKLSSDGKRKGA